MRVYKGFLMLLLFGLLSCKSSRVFNEKGFLKKITTKQLVKNHLAAQFKEKSLEAKMILHYKSNTEDEQISLKLRILKDSIIWLKGSKLITLFKAKITPTSISYYSPLQKKYFKGDFDLLTKVLGTKIDFYQLQHLFFGEAILDLKAQKYKASVVDKNYVLTPKKKVDMKAVVFRIAPLSFKLREQSVSNLHTNEIVQISYPTYMKKENTFFPKNIKIKALKKDAFTNISLETKQLVLNKSFNYSYRIPKAYKRVEI